MLLPIKFIVANIFISGMTAGALCGAMAAYTLSNPERVSRLKECMKEMSEGDKK